MSSAHHSTLSEVRYSPASNRGAPVNASSSLRVFVCVLCVCVGLFCVACVFVFVYTVGVFVCRFFVGFMGRFMCLFRLCVFRVDVCCFIRVSWFSSSSFLNGKTKKNKHIMCFFLMPTIEWCAFYAVRMFECEWPAVSPMISYQMPGFVFHLRLVVAIFFC